MTMNQNTLMAAPKKKTFSTYLTGDAVKNKINQVIGSKEGVKFIANLISLVSNNPAIAECEHSTILSSALLGESLKLSPSPQLGHYYIVPFKDNDKNGNLKRIVATFQLGYKGYIQLAMRSGNYKDLDVIEIREGEYKGKDKTTGKAVIEFLEDDEEREGLPVVGYYAYFELLNGFKKSLYWSKTKMQNHAEKYSQAYRTDLKKNWHYSFWSKDFDGMAFKTMLRQLISKWGILSVEFQTAMANDMSMINEEGQAVYVDNTDATEAEVIEPKEYTTIETEESKTEAPDPLDNFD